MQDYAPFTSHMDKYQVANRLRCSYFASSSSAMQLYAKHFHFIGVVKSATRQYPKAYLGAIEMPIVGQCRCSSDQLMVQNYWRLNIAIAIGITLSQLVLTLQVAIRFSVFGCGSWNQSKQTKNPDMNTSHTTVRWRHNFTIWHVVKLINTTGVGKAASQQRRSYEFGHGTNG
jgi:hypothetical protein